MNIINEREEERKRIAAKNKQKQILRKVKNKIKNNAMIYKKELIEDSTKRVEIERHDNVDKIEKEDNLENIDNENSEKI